MHAPDHPDPWASLAETLGVGGGSEPEHRPATPPPARTPPRPADRAADRPKPRATATPSSWDDLASDLGIAPAPSEPAPHRAAEPPRPARPPRQAEHRPPRETHGDADAHRERRRPPVDGEAVPREEFHDDAPRGDGATPSARDDDGERRGRRGRGRRGGRRRREGEGVARTDEAATPRHRDEPAPRPDDRDRNDDEFAPRDEGRADTADGAGRGEPPAEGDDDRPRRRRRRGRRGGRGRSRSREGVEPRADAREPGTVPGSGEPDDEPLPTSYGMRAASRPPEARDRGADGDASGAGASRGRRRRRRKGGDDRQARPASGRTAGDSDRGRRSRRGRDERGGSSRSSRVRRADFAPVAGAYDEDDEGLDFLGVEDATREPGRRPSQGVSDDVLAASGLEGVRDVPSWVEAIGIVIAGNLDARNRGRGDGGRRDR